MANDPELERRKSLTFEQAEGLAPLPSQLALGQITPTLRARLWEAVYQRLLMDRSWAAGGYVIESKSAAVMRRYYIERLGLMADEISNGFDWTVKVAKSHFASDDYARILGFVQWLVRELGGNYLRFEIDKALREERAAYRLIDGVTIAPIASEQEGRALEGAVAALSTGGLEGARKHLVDAAAKLTEGQFAESIRESVHAVESLVRTRTGKGKFSDALRELDSQNPMHGSFKSALEKLYGYASDEKGIRHPLLEEGNANVTERDALFVLGVCASFVTYLLSAPMRDTRSAI